MGQAVRLYSSEGEGALRMRGLGFGMLIVGLIALAAYAVDAVLRSVGRMREDVTAFNAERQALSSRYRSR